MPTWLIWVIVIVVVLVVIAAVVSMMNKRRTEQRRTRAEALRQEATAQASGLTESERQAEELRAKADLAKAEAQKVEQQAATAEQGHQVEQASYEDKLREADRLDPDVDHRATEYQPDLNGNPSHRGAPAESERGTWTQERRVDGPANPVPPGPETTPPTEAELEAERSRRDQI